MVNTEKPSGKQEKKKQGIVKTPTKIKNIPVVKEKKKVEVKDDNVKTPESEIMSNDKTSEVKEKVEEKKEIKPTKPKVKKTEVKVSAENLPLSTKQTVAICKFIKNKKIPQAIKDLEQVSNLRKAVPMRGEIAHQKGKGMMSGKFPVKASKSFIILLKSLASNALANEIENPTIVEAMSNIGKRPYARFGKFQRKRSHIVIRAREIKKTKKVNKQTPEKK